MGRGGVRVEPSTFLEGPRRSYRWEEIERVERTSRGLRFRCGDRGKTFVVGTPTGAKRLLQLVEWYCPQELFDSAEHPTSWSRWDPTESSERGRRTSSHAAECALIC
jgi:hypothetical protein